MEKRQGRRRERDKACACWICSTSLFLYFTAHPPLYCLSPVIQSLVIKSRAVLPLDRLFYLQYMFPEDNIHVSEAMYIKVLI